MIVLGIETSCDETSVGLVDQKRHILCNLVYSQLKDHQPFGGVVPEIAARAHLEKLDGLIARALNEANLKFHDLDAIAATCGPGLIGGVMVGMMAGKTISAVTKKPFVAINHLEGHVLSPRLSDNIEFPYLSLLVSGGHTQILIAHDIGKYERLGTTLDDALGEAFDKCAKIMGLGYPGGPELELLAQACTNPDLALKKFNLPHPMVGRKDCDFSFSGLKTAVRQAASGLENPKDPDLAYAFQYAVLQSLLDRCSNAIRLFKVQYPALSITLTIVGGVAANKTLRKGLEGLAATHNTRIIAPPLSLCSDNGAMIAWAGLEKLTVRKSDSLDTPARPRWPLDPDAEKKPGAGIKA